MGSLYIDVHGHMILKNMKNKEQAKITFHGVGMFSKKKGLVDGVVTDEKGKERYKVHGQWNDKLYLTDLETKEEKLIWTIHPKVENSERQYAFNKFTVNLNYLDEEMK